MVFDDDGNDRHDLIGRVWITLEPDIVLFEYDPNQDPVEVLFRKPKWYNIIYDANDTQAGKLLLSYTLIKKEEANLVPMEDMYPKS